jgi:D-glycerate 3-kinase
MPRPPHPTPIKSGPSAPRRREFDADLVADLLDDALRHEVRVFGIAGLQGSGKSTLAAQVVALARARGLRAATLSIDDGYLNPGARRRLARTVHPLLATRGPPGTHDVALLCGTLDAVRTGRATRLPRFDKRHDRRLPPSRWPAVGLLDLLVFEGWCLKVPAEGAAALATPVNALEREEDSDGTWRRWCNAALGRDDPALWARIDRLLWLQPPGFEGVADWRWQQEQALAGGPRLSRPDVERFVQHFERVSRQALRCLPAIADRTLRLDAGRRVIG